MLDPEGAVDATQDNGRFARWGEPAHERRGVHAGTVLQGATAAAE